MTKQFLGVMSVAAIVWAGWASESDGAQAPAPESSTGSVEFSEPVGDLTLSEALAAALGGSPEMDAYSLETRAREAEALGAGVRPNPEIGVELENFGGSGPARGFGDAEATLTLSQAFELGGKRGKRLAVAEREQSLAAWDYEIARVDLFVETKKAFAEVLAAQELLALSEEVVVVAEEVLESVSRRVTAGSASPIEKNRAQVELETTRIDRDHAASDLATARTRLAAKWGGTTARFSKALGDIGEIPESPSLESLQSLMEESPSHQRWAAELDRRNAVLELERARKSPDLTLGSGLRYLGESDDVSLLVELSVPLPLFDKNEGPRSAALLRVEQAESERRAAEVRIRTQLATVHEELVAAESELRSLRDRALPAAELAFESAREAFLRGSMRLTDVLDTERLLFDLKSRHITALTRYHSAYADLERLTGAFEAPVPATRGRN